MAPMHQRKGTNGNSSLYSDSNGNGKNMYGGRGAYSRGGDIEGGGGGGGGRYNDTNANILEQQNNERIYELSEQVARLKGLTRDINNEVREQNTLLDTMGEGFMSTRDLIQGSLTRIGTMLESGGAKHMCYMVAFVVSAVVFLYWLMTRR